VRAAVTEHLEPSSPGSDRAYGEGGRRGLQGMATDEIMEGLRYVHHPLGEEQRTTRELELLLPGATGPYVGSAAFREPTGPQDAAPAGPEGPWRGSQPTRDRARATKVSAVAAN
jgi:hypothetical protein